MKVGLVTTEFLPVWGGIASYCLNICSALSDKVELHVFTPSRKVKGAGFTLERLDTPDVKMHIISSTTDASFSTLKYQILLARKLPQLINENHLDLIHSATPLADQLVRVLGSSIPYVLTYHTTFLGQRRGTASSSISFKDTDSSERMTLLLYPFLKLYESVSLKRTKNIIAVSKAVRDELVTQYGYQGKITIIPNGIDTSMFQVHKANRLTRLNRRVLFSGRLIALKGPKNVIRAMPEVLRQHPDIVFVFAGAGNREPYLRMLQEMKIPQQNFDFCYVNYQDMPDFYNSGDVLVLPSLLESFPITILEAMACGLPVIASNVGDVAELVREEKTGFLIERGDHHTLALRINQLLDDESLRQRMGENARKLVEENYSLESMGKKTFEVYREVLGG